MLHVNPSQLRAARSLLGWPRRMLAQRAGIGTVTVARLEGPLRKGNQTFSAHADTVARAVGALEAAGVRFERGGVVRHEPGK